MSLTLSDDDKDDILLACRYGDLEDVQAFVKQHGASCLTDIRDENENSVLHMVCANGHVDLLNYLLPVLASTLIASKNKAGSTPLHWAALNSQLDIAQKLVQHPDGPGRDLIDIKNTAGRSPLGEAELAGWEEGARWFVEMMNLDPEGPTEGKGDDAGDEENTVGTEGGNHRDIEVEIEDADGQIAKMTLSASNTSDAPKSSTS
ncbi:hypothetical protein GALMADRAFT_248063 [Galerina marginata CBS 339.88]|uniref:Uncharacterized protein n=1 Tax=Galerina marginata (strain CBS 339.88) TaxID=685588 RepID=A0A067SXB7_GALM3|nr:hypothetical protein GALMADRAFT_248063 [Galerina marginata CBS 339.88]